MWGEGILGCLQGGVGGGGGRALSLLGSALFGVGVASPKLQISLLNPTPSTHTYCIRPLVCISLASWMFRDQALGFGVCATCHADLSEAYSLG